MHSQACTETWVEAMSHRQRRQGHGSEARHGSHTQDCGWAIVREQSDGTGCPAGSKGQKLHTALAGVRDKEGHRERQLLRLCGGQTSGTDVKTETSTRVDAGWGQ